MQALDAYFESGGAEGGIPATGRSRAGAEPGNINDQAGGSVRP